MTNTPQTTFSVDDISIQSAILWRAWIAIVFDFLDKPTTKPVNSHNGIDVFYYDNLFIFSFDTEEKRGTYHEAFSILTNSPSGYVPRIGNFFERNGKYFFVGDYDDTRLANISDTTETNWILYRGVVINPMIYKEQQQVSGFVQDSL